MSHLSAAVVLHDPESPAIDPPVAFPSEAGSRAAAADIVPATAPEEAPILSIDRLTVVFDRYGLEPKVALNEVELCIRRGEMVGLVGESGSGKTTLARAIMAAIPEPGRIESGEIVFDGKGLDDLPEEDRRSLLGRDLSMIVPNPRSELNPVLTVGDQIANVIRYHQNVPMKIARQRALDMLKAVSIPDPERRMKAYPHELSGGMAQRVVIAVALACSPRFVISDDATSGLDVTVQTQVLELMTALVRNQNASALFITRDIAITAHFCSRIIILYAGEVVEIADTAVFFDRPGHPYSIMLLTAFTHDPELRARWIAPEAELPEDCACAFAARCVRRQERCIVERPSLRRLSSGQQVRCHFPVEA